MRGGTNGSNGAYNRNGYGQQRLQRPERPNGHTPQDASGDAEMEQKIDQAAEAGRQPARRRGAPDPGDRGSRRRPGRPLRGLLTRWRSTTTVPQPRYESCCIAVGEDPDREGLRDTPDRVARAYAETFAGLDRTPDDVLRTTFDDRPRRDDHRARHRGLQHLRAPPRPVPRGRPRRVHPRQGRPRHRPVQDRPPRRPVRPSPPGPGASHHADRRRAREAADVQGVIVVVECEHLCMSMRGVRKPGSRTITSRRPRPAARPRHPSRGDVAHARWRSMTGRRSATTAVARRPSAGRCSWASST